LGEALVSRLEQANNKVFRLGRDGVIPEGLNVVFDCAAFGNLAGHRGDPKEIYKANLMRVITEMDYLDDKTKYIYISSSSVARPTQITYSLSKKAAEEFLQIQDKKIAIVRPFSMTGIGDQPEHLIPTLIRSCLKGEEMPFVPEPHHDYIDVDDVVDALLIIADKGLFEGEVYQVGRGKSYSNQEVREMVENATGKKANVQLVESMRSYDSTDWVSDNTRIWSLGWKITKSLEQTIQEMVNYARKNITD